MTLFWSTLLILTAITFLFLLIPVGIGMVRSKTTFNIRDTGVVLFVFIVIFGVSFWGYMRWGYSDAWFAMQAQQLQIEETRERLADIQSPKDLIVAVKERVDREPENPEGWRLLGRLQLANQQNEEAVASFERAYALAPDDQQVILQYAEALFIQQQQLTAEIEGLLAQVLEAMPNHPIALNLLAIGAYQSQQYEKAVMYWQQLLRLYPKDSPAAAAIEESIAKANMQLQKDS